MAIVIADNLRYKPVEMSGVVRGMKLVELFCGCGGFSRGAHDAGFDVSAAYDIDPILTSSYVKNFPNTNLHLRDVAELTGNEIRRDIGGEAFGVFGGPPCQGFSEIGKRNPNDPRRDLLGDFFRIVSELQPVFFIMENVRGLAYPGARPVLDQALRQVTGDYNILGPLVWEAAQFGAATTRPRMFVIGVRKSEAVQVTLSHIERQMTSAATVADAISDLCGATQLYADDGVETDRWQIDPDRPASAYATTLRAPDLTFTGHRVTAHTPAVIERFAATLPGGYERVGRHPRLAPEGQCPTLRAGTGVEKGSFQSVRPIHPTENRVITVREAARLQGFPDDHLFHDTVWHSFRMIGNSVSPIIAKAIFRAIRDALAIEFSPPLSEPEKIVDFATARKNRRRRLTQGQRFSRLRRGFAGR